MIAQLRVSAGLSRAELARRTGISPSSIARYEAGARVPDERLRRLLDACQASGGRRTGPRRPAPAPESDLAAPPLSGVEHWQPFAERCPVAVPDLEAVRVAEPFPLEAGEVLSRSLLAHVGALEPARRGENGDFEAGAGLSVSDAPEAWRRIARLGDAPEHILAPLPERDAGPAGQFLDALALHRRGDDLYAWAVRNGLIEPTRAWRVSWVDGETDEEVFALFENADEAAAEAECIDDARLEEEATYRHTERLCSYVQRRAPSMDFVFDDLCVAAARCSGLDGVAWDERLAPEALSAPRAVILPERLAEWAIRT